jgi:hypothetical protein
LKPRKGKFMSYMPVDYVPRGKKVIVDSDGEPSRAQL